MGIMLRFFDSFRSVSCHIDRQTLACQLVGESAYLSFVCRKMEDALNGIVGDGSHFFGGYTIGFGKFVQHKTYVGALVAATSFRNRSHVGGIGLQDDTAQGDRLRQHLGQGRFLESEHTSDIS